MTASDKLFYWLFQNHPDRILELQQDLPPEANGWRFSAPVVKEREHRLDGLFQPPASQPELPVVLLEAQMAADGRFLRRLYAQSARLVEHEVEIEHSRVVVICPHRQPNFGSPAAVAEFVRERVHWVELRPAACTLRSRHPQKRWLPKRYSRCKTRLPKPSASAAWMQVQPLRHGACFRSGGS